MKKLTLLLCLLLAACAKKQSFDYSLGATSSFDLANNSTAQWKIPISRTSGSDELVMVTVGTLPKGVSVINPTVTARSGDTAVFTLTSLFAMPGDYSVGIASKSSSSVIRNYSTVLRISPSGACASVFAGNFIARHAMVDSFSGYYSGGFVTDYVEEIIPESSNKVMIKKMGARIAFSSASPSLDAIAVLNCDYGTFDIPLQGTGLPNHIMDSIMGSGYYKDGQIIINYEVIQWGGPGTTGTPKWIRHTDTLQL